MITFYLGEWIEKFQDDLVVRFIYMMPAVFALAQIIMFLNVFKQDTVQYCI